MNFLKKLNFDSIEKLIGDKYLLYSFVLLGVVSITLQLLPPKTSKEPASSESEAFDFDTMIPSGHILIPIQLSNAESLASLTGQFAVIDLYTVNERDRKGFKVASAIKLLRAPLNPQQFAVLVREEESSKIVTQEGPFFAALKNRDEKIIPNGKKSPKKNLVITYGG
ncbi:MAG: hypothetical protein IPM97_10015 [Bdellovibrionaceae bacterium]|nr:hypothetical protein [Pseudobdellovibrionaceae bacterium]